jgi:hypothetical protein
MSGDAAAAAGTHRITFCGSAKITRSYRSSNEPNIMNPHERKTAGKCASDKAANIQSHEIQWSHRKKFEERRQ